MEKGKEKILKHADIALLVLFPLIAVAACLLFQVGYLVSSLLFFGPLALWLSYRKPQAIKKTFLFSLVLSTLLTVFVDYLATTDGAWFVGETAFPFRFFGIVPAEDSVLGFLLTYNVILFYEHFLEKGKHGPAGKQTKHALWVIGIFLALFILAIVAKPELVRIPYAYAWMGLVLLVIPTAAFLSFFPRLIGKYAKVACYFSAVLLIIEMTGLQLQHWSFPGLHFIGWVELFRYRFPFEEFLFFIIMTTIGILTYYELFADDRK